MTRVRLFTLILPALLFSTAAWGRDDLCVRDHHFLCEVLQIPLVVPRDAQPLMGDVDGDGIADSCMFQQGRFFCQRWQSQEGRFIPATFDLRQERDRLGGGTPLLGDMDGDGRADPCLYAHGRLVCGLFPVAVTGGKPARTLEIRFGEEGDIPVLGDVDGD